MSSKVKRIPPDYAVLVGGCVHDRMDTNVFADKCVAQISLILARVGSQWVGEAYAFAEYQPVVDTYVVICQSDACPDMRELYATLGIKPCAPVREPRVDPLSKRPVTVVEY